MTIPICEPSIHLTTSSIFANVAKLVNLADRRWGQVRIGTSWGLGIPKDHAELAEYTWPFHLTPFTEALANRGGIYIRSHRAAEGQSLRDVADSHGTAIVIVDSFYLPYRPAYGRVHSGRSVLLRAGTTHQTAWIEDLWIPTFSGLVSWDDIDRARNSSVPFDALREPIFSGIPIRGDWYSVEVDKLLWSDPREWLIEMMKVSLMEALTERSDQFADFGLGGWVRLKDTLVTTLLQEPGKRCPDTLRRACLTIRAELSSRVWWAGLVRRAADTLDDHLLAAETNRYVSGLEHLQMVRDVLAKAAQRPKSQYARYVADRMDTVVKAETRMADILAAATS